MHNATHQTKPRKTPDHILVPHSDFISALRLEPPGVVQTRDPTPPAIPDSPQAPNHQLTPFEYIPLGHESPPPVTADTPDVVRESLEGLVERVREVVPDVLPAHVFRLLSIHETVFPDNLPDVVIHILLEDQSYPKDLKGKGKARDEDDEDEVTVGFLEDTDMNLGCLSLDANWHPGSTYWTLSLVRFEYLPSTHR
jgi:hypothetical protein